jgi:hypothetical protein
VCHPWSLARDVLECFDEISRHPNIDLLEILLESFLKPEKILTILGAVVYIDENSLEVISLDLPFGPP